MLLGTKRERWRRTVIINRQNKGGREEESERGRERGDRHTDTHMLKHSSSTYIICFFLCFPTFESSDRLYLHAAFHAQSEPIKTTPFTLPSRPINPVTTTGVSWHHQTLFRLDIDIKPWGDPVLLTGLYAFNKYIHEINIHIYYIYPQKRNPVWVLLSQDNILHSITISNICVPIAKVTALPVTELQFQ